MFWEKGQTQNPNRLMRELEVIRTTERSVLDYQQKIKKERSLRIVKIGLELPREILYERINKRVDKMQEQGLEAEAKDLSPYKALNALQTVGYRELFDHFENKISQEKAFDLIKQNTRHYAKRQMTWFKKDPEVQWVAPSEGESLILSLNINPM